MKLGLRRGTVAVVPHDPAWETAASRTIAQLQHILRDIAIDIQHVGSTAVKGICAKPIIDIAVGISDPAEILRYEQVLAENGFLYRGQDLPGQYLLVCGDQDSRTHHIHVVTYSSAIWEDYIGLRDLLNADEDAAKAYSALKTQLAAQYPDNRVAYTDGKSEMIRALLQKARAQKERCGKTPGPSTARKEKT
ncbi:MAG: GrpB family protein [Oscillospiraceae bacterium]|nr:GrpB family protein [Oscillospiraceae bacterium]